MPRPHFAKVRIDTLLVHIPLVVAHLSPSVLSDLVSNWFGQYTRRGLLFRFGTIEAVSGKVFIGDHAVVEYFDLFGVDSGLLV